MPNEELELQGVPNKIEQHFAKFQEKKEAGIYHLFTVGKLHVHISAKYHEKKHDEMIFLSGDIPPNMTPPLK